jgi:hypothetical protein
MNVSIIIAIIGGAVTASATAANVLIAARSRRAALDQVRWQATLRLADERISRLRLQAAETERLRAECALFATTVEMSQHLDEQPGEERWRKQAIRLEEQFDQFWRLWAETKEDIPDRDRTYIRQIRHELQTPWMQLNRCVAILGNATGDKRSEAIAGVLHVLRWLASMLDAFYEQISELRSEEIEATFAGASSTVRPSNARRRWLAGRHAGHSE